jgi:spore germination cell wall hydrolase CwlJ-like protein
MERTHDTRKPEAKGRGRAGLLTIVLGAVLLVAGILGSRPAEAMSSDQEISCLAQTIYYESRGEPAGGMLAVGHVVLNRSRDPSFPRGICAVVHQRSRDGRCQFTFACDSRSRRANSGPDWVQSVALAKEIYYGRTADPTGGALWFQQASVRAGWAPGVRRTARIGHHVFYSRRGSA